MRHPLKCHCPHSHPQFLKNTILYTTPFHRKFCMQLPSKKFCIQRSFKTNFVYKALSKEILYTRPILRNYLRFPKIVFGIIRNKNQIFDKSVGIGLTCNPNIFLDLGSQDPPLFPGLGSTQPILPGSFPSCFPIFQVSIYNV